MILSDDHLNVQDYGAVGDGVTDDGPAIRLAIKAAMTSRWWRRRSTVFFPEGVYLTSRILVPSKGGRDGEEGWWEDADPDQTLIFQGAGMYTTSIKAAVDFGANGMIGYGSSGVAPVVAQVICKDLTLDGNYSGVDDGEIDQAVTLPPALVCLPYPHRDVFDDRPNGKFHVLERVRFYRPSGYGLQILRGMEIRNCVFDQCGQPDLEDLHYDILGSGSGDLRVIGCTYVDSSGNYADMINDDETKFIRAVFTGNTSLNHGLGGLYIGGQGSVISGNSLQNNEVGGGVGYDAGTHVNARSKNVVTGNTFTNLNVFSSGFSAEDYGDLIYGNISDDSPVGSTEVRTVASVANQTTTVGTSITAVADLSITVPVGTWMIEAEVYVVPVGESYCSLTVSPSSGPTTSALDYNIVSQAAWGQDPDIVAVNKTAFNSASAAGINIIRWIVRGTATVSSAGTLSISMTRTGGTSVTTQVGSFVRATKL